MAILLLIVSVVLLIVSVVLIVVSYRASAGYIMRKSFREHPPQTREEALASFLAMPEVSVTRNGKPLNPDEAKDVLK